MSDPSALSPVIRLLVPVFTEERAVALGSHYVEMIEEFRKSHWESTIVKAGKFTEAVLKCLLEHAELPVPADKLFKVDKAIQQLEQLPQGHLPDAVRLTIPRSTRFIYEVASNRGARHDSGELDPNLMDASAVSSLCSWVLAELIRYSQRGLMSPPEAARTVVKLSQKKYPLFEEIDGRIYFARSGQGARKLGLLLLAYKYPDRVSRTELIDTLVRHGEKRTNAQVAFARLKGLSDDDGHGTLKLRSPGLQEAEKLLATLTALEPSE